MQERPTFRNRRLDIMAGRKWEADKAAEGEQERRNREAYVSLRNAQIPRTMLEPAKTLVDCFKEIFGCQPSEEFLG